VIRALYKDGLIAYKGGHLEKDLLDKMGLPSVNLEDFGCPKADSLRSSHYPPGKACGFHKEHVCTTFIHCPKQETYLFFQWLKNKLKE